MNCNKYLPLLSGHLDGVNSEAEELQLQKHLTHCKQCRRLLAQLEQTDALLLSSKAVPPAELSARIMSQVHNEPKRKKTPRRALRSVCVGGFAAAALLALVFFGDLKLPFLKQDGDMEAAAPYSDAENAYAATPEDAELLFRNNGSAAAQTDDYGTTPLPESSAPDAAAAPPVERSTEKGTSLTAMESDAFSPTLPPLNDNASSDILDDPKRAEGADTTQRLPYGLTASEAASPLLVIRGVQAEELSLVYGLSPSEESTSTFSDEADSLYTRLLSALPLAKELSDAASQYSASQTATKYFVSYEQFSSIFSDYVGVYETAVYYPPNLGGFESCTVLVISDTVFK